MLKNECLFLNGDNDGFKEDFIYFLSHICEVSKTTYEHILSKLELLSTIDNTCYSRLDSLIRELSFFNEDYKSFMLEYLYITFKYTKRSCTMSVLTQIATLDSKEFFVTRFLSFAYLKLNKLEKAIECLTKHPNVINEVESPELYWYIICLARIQNENEKLLRLLKKWRMSFTFSKDLFYIELDLYSKLRDWDTVYQMISDKGSLQDENILTRYLNAIDQSLTIDKQEIKELLTLINEFNFSRSENKVNVGMVLIRNNFVKIGLDLIYDEAILSDRSFARKSYMNLFFMTSSELRKIFNETKEVVSDESVIKIKDNNNVEYYINYLDNNSALAAYKGKRVGDCIEHQSKFRKGEIKTEQIMLILNKYQKLHLEIMNELSKPSCDYPMESFELKRNSPEELVEFIKGFGGEDYENEIADQREKYYQYKISFVVLGSSNYRGNYIEAYHDLIRNFKGIASLPMAVYEDKLDLIKQTPKVILDYTSLLTLFQICEKHEIEFDNEFIISKTIVEQINSMLNDQSFLINSNLTVNVSHNSIEKINATDQNTRYLNSLLEWIDKNCTVTYSVHRLDNSAKEDPESNNDVKELLFDTFEQIIRDDENVLIVSDDVLMYQFAMNSCISTEAFLRGANVNESVFIELVINKYRSISITSELVLNEYKKLLDVQPNFFEECFKHLCWYTSQNIEIIESGIKFLFVVYTDDLIGIDDFRTLTRKYFSILFKGQSKVEFYDFVKNKIKIMNLSVEFKSIILEEFENTRIEFLSNLKSPHLV